MSEAKGDFQSPGLTICQHKHLDLQISLSENHNESHLRKQLLVDASSGSANKSNPCSTKLSTDSGVDPASASSHPVELADPNENLPLLNACKRRC
jgi:hypothetical protein